MSGKNKNIKKKVAPVKKFNQKLHDWFRNDTVGNHEDEIIGSIKDKSKSFDEVEYSGTSVIFWSAKKRYENILKESLKWNIDNIINNVYDKETALSISAYYGYDEIVILLLKEGASIEVRDDHILVDTYKSLGRGYLKWPTDFEDYEKAFKALMDKDSSDRNRQFFIQKYNLRKEKEYLACLRLYDQVESRMEYKGGHLYRDRDILITENTAIKRFFRFSDEMRQGGIAEVLKPLLFSGQTIPIDGYSSRSVIIALVNKMRRTPKNDVKNAANAGGNFYTNPKKRIFLVKFSLGATQLLYEWRPAPWQRGNSIIKVNNRSPDLFGAGIAGRLEQLTNTNNHETNERTKKLGELFLKKTKELQPFRHYEFTYSLGGQNNLLIRTRDDHGKTVATLAQAQETIDVLNGLLVLWSIVEPVRRLSGHTAADVTKVTQDNLNNYMRNNYEHISKRDAINLDHIPVATMQIRALQLLSEGYIALRDIFGESTKYPPADEHRAEYGVSTGKDLVKQFLTVREKSERLAKIDLPHHALASTSSFFSRNYTKQLLQEGYGTADESNDDNYSDNEIEAKFIQ